MVDRGISDHRCQLPPTHNTLTILNPGERCTEAEALDERIEIFVAVE